MLPHNILSVGAGLLAVGLILLGGCNALGQEGAVSSGETLTLPTTLSIENMAGGKISAHFVRGAALRIGTVVIPLENSLTAVQVPGFTAANFLERNSCVVATAANAIHVRVRLGPDGMAQLFSFLPQEFAGVNKDNYKSYSGAAVFTDIAGGTGLFGKEYAPFLGNRILVQRAGLVKPMDEIPDYRPQLQDVWRIQVELPRQQATRIHFVNRFNGAVWGHFYDGTSRCLARVVKPVSGVGEFPTAAFLQTGQIRAHHPGVFEIVLNRKFSTLDANLLPPPAEGRASAFQLVPFAHTTDYAMPDDTFHGEGFFGYARILAIYMLLETPQTQLEELERFSPDAKGSGQSEIALRRKLIKSLRQNSQLLPQALEPFHAIPKLAEIVAKYHEIADYFETRDRDGSTVFARLLRPPQHGLGLYAREFLFGEGWLRPGEGKIRIKTTSQADWHEPSPISKGKDFQVLQDWEEIMLELPYRHFGDSGSNPAFGKKILQKNE